MVENISNNIRPGITSRWIPVSNIALGILLVGMVWFGFSKGIEMNTVYAPLIHADTQIKLKVTAAHMWVEEILGGDRTKDIRGVWDFLDQADWYAQAMLQGGENEEGMIVPLDDPEMRRVIQEVVKNLVEFRSIAQGRLANRETSGTGSELDKHYDEVYKVFIQKADRVKERLQDLMAEDLKYFEANQFTLMGVGFLLSMTMTLAVYRFENFRDRLIQALQETNQTLEGEIKERKQAEQKLTESGNQLRRLTNQLQTIREEEKTRIAREVHDELGQTLTALKMELTCLGVDIANQKSNVKERMGSMSELIDNTISSVQRIATSLRPQILDVLGLPEAIRLESSEFEKRTGIRVETDFDTEDMVLEGHLATTLFRIFQESMTNVARHSKANHVHVNLFIDEGEHIVLEIRDNGKGIKNSEIVHPQSLGLLGINERVLAWKGQTLIEGSDAGTVVRVLIPLKQYEKHQIQN